MSPTPRLTLPAGTLAAILSLALPAAAQGAFGEDAAGSPPARPQLQYAAPLSPEPPAKRAREDVAPKEQQQPEAPSGCPFRNQKLELIV